MEGKEVKLVMAEEDDEWKAVVDNQMEKVMKVEETYT